MRKALQEDEGFEPSVPGERNYASRDYPVSPLRHFPSVRGADFRERDRGFGSRSLQRRVWCEPDFSGRIPSMTVGDLTYASARQEADADQPLAIAKTGASAVPKPI